MSKSHRPRLRYSLPHHRSTLLVLAWYECRRNLDPDLPLVLRKIERLARKYSGIILPPLFSGIDALFHHTRVSKYHSRSCFLSSNEIRTKNSSRFSTNFTTSFDSSTPSNATVYTVPHPLYTILTRLSPSDCSSSIRTTRLYQPTRSKARTFWRDLRRRTRKRHDCNQC